MMLRQAHSISWVVLEGTFCGSEALCVTEKVALARWDVSWPSAIIICNVCGGGGSVICADMREHCCAERGCVPIGGGLGGVRCRCRDASAARDARAQFQQAAL
eukprot:COSAG01_NODE_22950_length_834_cov_46.944218_1_plen_102_part_10